MFHKRSKNITENSDSDSPSDKQFTRVAGDSSSKQIYRQREDPLTFGGIESSIIIDFSNVDDVSDEYFHISSIYYTTQYELYREINTFLYIKIPHSIGCRVPEIYASNDFCRSIQIEDLGSINLKERGYNFTIYKNLIRWLAYLDKLYHENRILHFIKEREYETEAINDELADFIQYYDVDFDYYDVIEDVLEKIHDIPKSICHRDFQPRNIMIHKGEPRIIDVQDMSLGPMTYDLGCLLYDPEVRLDQSDIHSLTVLYALLTNREVADVKKWTKTCGKIRLMKSAGRHAIIFQKTGNKNNLERANKATDYLKIIS